MLSHTFIHGVVAFGFDNRRVFRYHRGHQAQRGVFSALGFFKELFKATLVRLKAPHKLCRGDACCVLRLRFWRGQRVLHRSRELFKQCRRGGTAVRRRTRRRSGGGGVLQRLCLRVRSQSGQWSPYRARRNRCYIWYRCDWRLPDVCPSWSCTRSRVCCCPWCILRYDWGCR